MSLKEIEEKKNILHLLEKDELVSMIHELLIHIKKSRNKSVMEKTEVRFLEKQMLKIRDQIDKIIRTKPDTDTDTDSQWEHSFSKITSK